MEKDCNIERHTISSRNRFSLTLLMACLIIGGLIIVAGTTITLYKTYKSFESLDKVLDTAVKERRYIDMKISDNSAVGFNATGESLGVLQNRNGTIITVTIYPRYSRGEYYRTPSGSIVNPYSIPNVSA